MLIAVKIAQLLFHGKKSQMYF